YHTTRTDVLAADLRLDDVFVTGAHTAWYYAPGAYLREYIGVLTYRLPLNIGVGIFCVVAAVAMAWATSRVGCHPRTPAPLQCGVTTPWTAVP
ncbi:hypothetical protein EFN05_11155, partial [Propionibacterium freudenreichii]|nr:hypothetical protein [Propionibacterium freudenreichii]